MPYAKTIHNLLWHSSGYSYQPSSASLLLTQSSTRLCSTRVHLLSASMVVRLHTSSPMELEPTKINLCSISKEALHASNQTPQALLIAVTTFFRPMLVVRSICLPASTDNMLELFLVMPPSTQLIMTGHASFSCIAMVHSTKVGRAQLFHTRELIFGSEDKISLSKDLPGWTKFMDSMPMQLIFYWLVVRMVPLLLSSGPITSNKMLKLKLKLSWTQESCLMLWIQSQADDISRRSIRISWKPSTSKSRHLMSAAILNTQLKNGDASSSKTSTQP